MMDDVGLNEEVSVVAGVVGQVHLTEPPHVEEDDRRKNAVRVSCKFTHGIFHIPLVKVLAGKH